MPRATNVVEPEKFDLKTLSGGWVLLRRLTYGQKLERKAMSSVASAETAGRSRNMKLTMAMINEQATLYDFQRCIVDHNLEDDNGVKLNLGDMAIIKSLDPRIGDEVEQLMNKINNFEEDDEELGN
jgi:hypothetical protein